jgi:hypothetical protein
MKCIKVSKIKKMKHIRRFNEELKPSTYRRSADNLLKLGHKRRSSVMKDWADNVENKLKEKEKQESLSFLTEYGPFKMNFIKDKDFIFTGNFYIAISGLDYSLKDSYFDLVDSDGVANYDISLDFDLGFIAADDETENELYKYIDIDKYYEGIYWNMSFCINIIRKGEKYINPNGHYHFGEIGKDSFKFYNRTEASKFRKLLSDAFLGIKDWGKSNWSKSLKDSVLKSFNDNKYLKLPEAVFNEESYQKIANSIKSLSLNKLYTE